MSNKFSRSAFEKLAGPGMVEAFDRSHGRQTDDVAMAIHQAGLADEAEAARKSERLRCAKIVRDALDTKEYERSLGQAIAKRILED